MESIYKSDKRAKKVAKLEHRLAKLNDPILFEERRISLAAELVQGLKNNTPNWGGLKLEFLKPNQVS